MRNIGIITILVIFGMSLWRASDRYRLVRAEPAVNAAPLELVEIDSPEDTEIQSVTNPVVEEPPALEVPDQPAISSEPVTLDSNTVVVKARQKLNPAGPTVKSFDQVVIPTLKINASVVKKPYSELSWDLTSLGQDVAQLADDFGTLIGLFVLFFKL